MLHDAHGFWIADAGAPPVLPPLEGEHTADVVIVGGGYTGMWTAWHLLAADPDASVILLEGGRCGHGPSGRNGGFVSPMDLGADALRADYGAAGDAWVAGLGAVRDPAAGQRGALGEADQAQPGRRERGPRRWSHRRRVAHRDH